MSPSQTPTTAEADATSTQDEDYYRARAMEERGAAADAAQANVALIHEELARLYDALADHPELRPVRKLA